MTANTSKVAFENSPMIKPTGFREYDARWLFGSELNLAGAQAMGLGFGTIIQSRKMRPDIIVGHDYRSYSSAVKYALISGLMSAGCHVHDIGLCTTPMAYFAQFHLDVQAVAMVTASHNENGWTGIKMGVDRPVTLGPDDMAELKSIVLGDKGQPCAGGGVTNVPGLFESYLSSLTRNSRVSRKLKVAAVCGNGTPAAFAPTVLRAIGCDVVEIDCDLDFTFPNYNPNPEDLEMLGVMQRAVKEYELDLAFGFDGDGDRCGIVDETGNVIYADKLGLMMARDIASVVPDARFVVDVKSTGLFATDPVLKSKGATVDYYKTGHSFIKRRIREIDAVAGFEKSGHFFFRAPFGLGYDDGFVTAIQVCQMLERARGQSLSELYRALPTSYCSPTVSPLCDDKEKYGVVERVSANIMRMKDAGELIAGKKVTDCNSINGLRFTFDNGSWGLIRASSNKPELVVVCESMESELELSHILAAVQLMLKAESSVKAFNRQL